MTIPSVEERIKELLRIEMNALADSLALNKVRTIEDYRFATGQINGLAVAERLVIDVFEAYREGSDHGN